MSEQKRKDPSAAPKNATAGAATGRHESKPGKRSGDVGRALRSVYDSTLSEDIPDDFLDLLGKLD